MSKFAKEGENVHSGSGSKSGQHDTGSVGPLTNTSKVDKNETVKNTEFAEGGDTHMFGEQAAGDQVEAKTGKSPTAAPGAKFASGGTNKMFGFAGSEPARAGITSAR